MADNPDLNLFSFYIASSCSVLEIYRGMSITVIDYRWMNINWNKEKYYKIIVQTLSCMNSLIASVKLILFSFKIINIVNHMKK